MSSESLPNTNSDSLKSVDETQPSLTSNVESGEATNTLSQISGHSENASHDTPVTEVSAAEGVSHDIAVTEASAELTGNESDRTRFSELNRKSSRNRQLSHNAAESKATELNVKLLKVISKGTKDMNNALQNLDSISELDALYDLISKLHSASGQVQNDLSVLQEVTKNKINPTINQTCNKFTTEIESALELIEDKITAVETHQRSHDQEMEREMEEQLRIINQEMSTCQEQRKRLVAKGKQAQHHQQTSQPQASGSEIIIKSNPSTPAYQRSETPLLKDDQPSDTLISYSKEIVIEEKRSVSPTPSTTSEASIRQLAACLAQTIKATKKTNIEPSIFSGDAMEFTEWEQDLDNYMESVGIEKPTEKMRYLKKYIGGNAREVISGQLFFQTEDAYLHARKRLRERFGNQFNIARTMREKLNGWPKINVGDSMGLRKFSDYLDHCSSGMRSISELSILDDPLINEQLANKLPDWAKRKWAGKVFSSKRSEHRYPTFSEFANFVAEEAEIMAEPILYQQCKSQRSVTLKPQLSDISRGHWSTLATTYQPSGKSHCHYCPEPKRDSHSSAHCGVLAEQPYDDRIKFIQKNGLCYGCLKPGHGWDSCTDKQSCFKCKSTRHPTCLHKRKQDWDDTRTAAAPITPAHRQNQSLTSTSTDNRGDKQAVVSTKTTTIHTDQLLSMILPVYISTRKNPNHEILVYALIDSQSDCSYITKEVAEVLNPKSKEISVTINTMTSTVDMKKLTAYEDLNVRGYSGSETIPFSALEWETISCNRNQIPHCGNIGQYPHLKDHMDKLPPLMEIPIGLLIGRDSPDALLPIEVISSERKGEPFAAKTILGWYVIGGSAKTYTSITTNMTTFSILENTDEDRQISQDDIKFLEIMNQQLERMTNGSIIMPLPFKARPNLPNNRQLAEKRLKGLMKKFSRDASFKGKYAEFMDDLITRGHAEAVTQDGKPGETWYIPHFAVQHPKKEKLRIVHDCSAIFRNECLNDKLLQGPDMVNSLVGILCRFRKEPIALACDVEKMFFNFYVKKEDRDYLRFLWFDQTGQIADYRMTVHLFGATSSPAVATYGLRQLAYDNAEKYPSAAEFIKRNFYVDDGVTSVPSADQAKSLFESARQLCSQGNLRLHKFMCNNREVMESVPASERSTDFDLFKDSLPNQRTLGLEWAIESDKLRFNCSVIAEKPQTRRGLLSIVSQIFDPLGLLSPFTLVGKNVLQEVNQLALDWDEQIPTGMQNTWNFWFQQLECLDHLDIPRCIKPHDFGTVIRTELHHFSDASTHGIGACSYIRLINEEGKIHTSLLMAKSRVIPSKGVITIPRLELQGALLATRLSKTLRNELDMKIDQEYLWTDSTIVLGYISNDSKKFMVYVANRVREIRQQTNPLQWHHIPGESNPADIASRGTRCQDLNDSIWFTGPDFLKTKQALNDTLDKEKQYTRCVDDKDPEVKKVKQTKATTLGGYRDIYQKFSIYQDYKTLKTSIANLKAMAKNRVFKVLDPVTPADLNHAENFIIKTTQARYFSKEIDQLRTTGTLNKSSKLRALDPKLDENGILRVGGRSIKSSTLNYGEKHPVILPKDSYVSELIVRHYHNKVHHQGRNFSTAAVRTAGYWITGLQGLVRSLLNRCITCIRIRKNPNTQKMGMLPQERVDPAPPFTHVGIDCFGHFTVKDRRTEAKRWGLVVSCMYSRAVHIELLESMTTDAFINALRSFICIRGPVKTIFCDNGSNFIGANNEFQREVDLTQDTIMKRFFSENMIEFKLNAPHASHTGGVWERQIRTARSILNGMASKYSGRLDTPTLRTAMYEVMATMNSRPLTTEQLNDPHGEIITPNHLITMKSSYAIPPPGEFVKPDIYGTKMWRKAQQFGEQFWRQWKSSYLNEITKRQKWEDGERNIKVGDIVLLVEDDKPRNQWTTGVVEEVHAGSDGLIRRAKVKLSNRYLDSKGKPMFEPSHLERAVQKLVLLIPRNE